MSYTFKTTLRSLELEVEYNYLAGSRGHCDKYGCPEEPDTPPECEPIRVSVIVEDQVTVVDLIEFLPEDDIETLIGEAFADMDKRAAASQEPDPTDDLP